MSERETEVREIVDHPAFRAWGKLAPARAASSASISMLARRKKSAVYRLHGISGDGYDLIGKRCRPQTALHEQRVYETILPQLPFRTLRFYGMVEQADEKASWLFMEDAGDQVCSYEQTDLAAAARWLAQLHTSTSDIANSNLPTRGAEHYLDHLTSGRAQIETVLRTHELATGEYRVLRNMVDMLSAVESDWQHVAARCASMPQAFVHGDLKNENLRLRDGTPESQLLALDWEMSGFGPLAIDLHPFLFWGRGSNRKLPIRAYASVVKRHWKIGESELEVMAHIGALFRLLAAIHWAGYDKTVKIMRRMHVYEPRFGQTIEFLGEKDLLRRRSRLLQRCRD